ncbi:MULTISPECIES: hypothetical protein [unclassified Paenibacillus]|uniref:hypothetical protein n=1 Tax=unclassified Paenibacillus TaxID=185978 RepID=UPI000930D8AE|nr:MULTISPECIES: hypothetical protein [unclassified Paenibacillus]
MPKVRFTLAVAGKAGKAGLGPGGMHESCIFVEKLAFAKASLQKKEPFCHPSGDGTVLAVAAA